MKKFTFHLDMVIVVITLLVLCIVGNLYQRKIHGELHDAYIALKKQSTNTELELILTKSALKNCENDNETQIDSDGFNDS